MLHKKQFIIKYYIRCFISISFNICYKLRYGNIKLFNLKSQNSYNIRLKLHMSENVKYKVI